MRTYANWMNLGPLLLLCAAGCSLYSPEGDSDFVTNLRFSPSAFDSFKANTQILYSLKDPGSVSIYITARDSSGDEFLVNTLMEDVHESKGSHAHTWLGDGTNGRFAPAGLYFGIVQVSNQRFETSVRVFHF